MIVSRRENCVHSMYCALEVIHGAKEIALIFLPILSYPPEHTCVWPSLKKKKERKENQNQLYCTLGLYWASVSFVLVHIAYGRSLLTILSTHFYFPSFYSQDDLFFQILDTHILLYITLQPLLFNFPLLKNPYWQRHFLCVPHCITKSNAVLIRTHSINIFEWINMK